MRRFWSWLAVELGKRAGVVAVVGLLVTLVLGFGITRLRFATGQDSYLNKSERTYKDNFGYQSLFGGEAMVVLLTMRDGKTVADLTDPAARRQIDAGARALRGRPEVAGVITPLDALQYSANLVQRSAETPGDPAPSLDPTRSIAGSMLQRAIAAETPGSAAAKARQADFGTTASRLLGVKGDKTFDNRQWVEFLLHGNDGRIRRALQAVFFDDTHAQVVVRLKGNATLDEQGRGTELVRRTWEGRQVQGATVTVTGAPAFLRDINDYLKGGMLTLGAIAVAIMVVILLVLFDVRWRLLPLAVVLIGVVWAFGLAGYLGIPLSLVTIAGLPVMLGVGIDYAIQMHARVEEEVVIDRESHPIQETARNLCPALLVVTFDAVFAFAALRFAKVPMIRQFGLLLAVGVAVICLASIILPLATLGIREYRSPTQGRDFREGALGRAVVWLGALPGRAAPVLIVASVVIFIGGVVTEGRLVLQTDPVEWVNQKSKSIRDFRVLQREADTASEMGVYVQAPDVFSDRVGRFVSDFAYRNLGRHGDRFLTANSLVTTITFLTDVPGAKPVPPTAAELRAAYAAAPRDIQRSNVSADGKAMNLIFLTKPGNLERLAAVVDDVRATTRPPAGLSATPAGLAVVGVGLLKNLEANRVLLTYLAIAFVFAFLAVRLRSIVRALLSLVPVLIATGSASLIAFALSLKLSPMTAVGGPLVVAVCTEFTSLILLRFVEERARGLDPREAVDVAAARTGRAFLVSAATAISGVLVISASSLPLLRGFGIIVGMNVAVALTSALVILPPMLVWADSRNWVSKGLVPDEVLRRSADEHRPTPAPVASPLAAD
ncbi:MAG: MMPL family transporter [Actinobacteria bacterium]|nr:MMPL family transporter [Actinomycetota bacterium]